MVTTIPFWEAKGNVWYGKKKREKWEKEKRKKKKKKEEKQENQTNGRSETTGRPAGGETRGRE